MKRCIPLVVLAFVSGCATNVTPMATGGSRADGIVQMSYEYGGMEQPTVDKTAALSSALRRCQTWGYSGAEAFDAGLQTCIAPGGLSGCARWRVSTDYQCTNSTDNPNRLTVQEKYGKQVRGVAESMECTDAATMIEATAESEKWELDCGDGERLSLRCFEDTCYVK